MKVLACWVSSWAAALGTFWVGAGFDSGTEYSPGFMLAVVILSIAAAVAAWSAVTHWWPE